MNRADGPKSTTDRIAILGAGPAGIHMAYRLVKAGYSNITLFERSDRIGGKSHTIEKDGVRHEMGTAYLNTDYRDVVALLDEFDHNEQVPYEGRTVWGEDGRPMTFEQWLVAAVRETLARMMPARLAAILPRFVVGLLLLWAISRYNRLHRRWFGSYEYGGLPPEPERESLRQIDGTFAQYLERHGLSVLEPIFKLTTTVQGYGYVETVPAFYGLMWNSPNFMSAVGDRLRGRGAGDEYTVLTSGWQYLWEKIVERYRLNVVLEQEIKEVQRSDEVRLTVLDRRKGGTGTQREYRFDHLIVACPVKGALQFLDLSEEESELFSAMKPATFTTTLFSSSGSPSRSYLDSWFHELGTDSQHSLFSHRHTVAATQPEMARRSCDVRRTCVGAQYGESPVTNDELEALFKKRMASFGASQSEALFRQRFDYFPRYTCEGIQRRYPWRLQALQGKNRTWFVGSSVVFESINAVVCYNNALVEEFLGETRSRSDTRPRRERQRGRRQIN